ncbi:uncharacterized protein LOC112096908 [Citrus clementina]|uniref:uncharacterized protein LOC112096908 n=1 Tax=Citrus clementina TaxID=85681 RepID=UPI000CED03E8|nr:uncharacterized protein LOC112096908 [Citrus x clementina]
MKHVGDLLNVSICKYGGSPFANINNSDHTRVLSLENCWLLGEKAVAPSEDRNLSAQTRSERAISRGDAQSVQVSMKHFSKSLQCHFAKPDCAFYGIAPQVACLTGIFQFFIPGIRETDKSILGQAEVALTAASSLFIRQFPNSMAFRNVFYACTLCWVQLN